MVFLKSRRSRIIVDSSVLVGSWGGISRITQQLTVALREVATGCRVTEASPHVLKVGPFECLDTLLSSLNYLYRYIIWSQIVLPIRCIVSGAKVIIAPNFVIPMVLAKRTVPIIHDIGHRDYSGGGVLCLYKWWVELNIRVALLCSPVVVVPSHYVKLDITRHYSHRADIVVIPWAVSSSLSFGAEPMISSELRYKLPKMFVLAVGTLPRKRIEFLTDVISDLRSNLDIELVVVGPVDDSMVARESLPGFVHFIGMVTDSELAVLYREASALAMAGVIEGFGIPALEAMAAGCPVVVSNAGSLPEVVGSAGIVVSAESIDEWSAGLFSLVSDESTRNGCIRRGKEWVREYNWKTSARKLVVCLLKHGLVSLDSVSSDIS